MKRKTLSDIVPESLGKQELRVRSVQAGEAPLPGLVSYTCLRDVKSPFISRDGRNKLLFDEGFRVLSYLPDGEHWCLTSVYDESRGDVEWYIDITRENERDGEKGWYDDVYLDVVVLPDGNILYLDDAELRAAVRDGEITPELAESAVFWRDSLIRDWLCEKNRLLLDGFMRAQLDRFEEK